MLAAHRKSICGRCREDCPVRETINLADPDSCCPLEKWVDAGWRDRQPKPQMPPIATQLKNAGRAIVDLGKAIMSDKPILASAEQLVERRALCVACPHLVNGRCTKCGCNYRRKVMIADWHCPIGNW